MREWGRIGMKMKREGKIETQIDHGRNFIKSKPSIHFGR
jgi:hypothetical protein